MFEKLNIFQMAQSLAKHNAARQSIIAQNVANADTPGYRARDLAAFSDTYGADAPTPTSMRATRPEHFLTSDATSQAAEAHAVYRPGAMSPNGNSVSIEQEMFAAAEAKQGHDQALAIYRSALSVLRASINTRS
ncbi:MAG: FlgB family protein [Maritimibacter sp.]|jgi:flagellar basal-body rod protein FlgB